VYRKNLALAYKKNLLLTERTSLPEDKSALKFGGNMIIFQIKLQDLPPMFNLQQGYREFK
jgi:hypothetical protein